MWPRVVSWVRAARVVRAGGVRVGLDGARVGRADGARSALDGARSALDGARVGRADGARLVLGSAWVALGVALAPAAACVRVEGYRCATDADCNSGAAGRCEPDGFCSFAGVGSCGRGYGEGAGSLSGTCLDDAATGGDRDDDGVADDRDNCVDAANADQADEDGDAVGDVCDNCPATANADQANRDSDGLGDGCDPRVGGGNRIVLFDPLNPASAADWSMANGTAEFRDDGLYLEGAVSLIDRAYFSSPGEVVAFSAQFTIDAVTAGESLALGIAAPIANLDLVACGVVDDVDQAPAYAAVVQVEGMGTTQIGSFPGALTAGTSGVVTYTPAVMADGAHCAVALRAIDVEGSVAVNRQPNGRVGFVQTNVTAVIPYLFAFTQ